MVIVAIESHLGALYMQISTIGLDIAKNVFQVHGIDAAEKVVVRKRLRRRQVLEFFKALPRCLIGMEAATAVLTVGIGMAVRALRTQRLLGHGRALHFGFACRRLVASCVATRRPGVNAAHSGCGWLVG